MKKKIIFVLLLGFIFISAVSIGFSASASQDDTTIDLDNGDSIMDITQNIAEEESIMPFSSNGEDYSQQIRNPLEHFRGKYPSYTWSVLSENATKNVSNHIPVNMQNAEFPKNDIQQAIINSGSKSSYGGCGPIAMIGLLDYFARYLGYTEVMSDPTDSSQRIRLATDILSNISTWELPAAINSTEYYNDIVLYSGDKNTLALPGDCVSGVNKVLKQYGLSNHLKADSSGSVIIGGNKNKYLKLIIEHIDKGLPVAVYTGLGTGSGYFSEHYFNVYEYIKLVGMDTEGNRIEKYALKACLNWTNYDNYYFDAELLNSSMCGVVFIDPTYCQNELIRASDFSEDFVNENNQGEYFFYEKSTSITTDSGYTFGTARLRCGYIENQYLVLSAKRENAGSAYLAFDLDKKIKKLEFTASLWSGKEGLSDADIFRIEYKDGNYWIPHVEYKISELSRLKTNQYKYMVLFPKNITSFRFYVYTSNPSGDRNKGRIVLDNINLIFNEHKYCIYEDISNEQHKVSCNCGEHYLENHLYVASLALYDNIYCLYCGHKKQTTIPV